MSFSKIAAAVVWVLLCLPAARGAGAPRIGVVSGGEFGPEADALGVTLAALDEVEVLERNRLDRIVAEQKLSAAGLTRDQAVALGAAAGADALVIVSADDRYGGVRRVRSRLVACATGVVLAGSAVPAPIRDPEEWAAAVARDVAGLSAKLAIPRDRAVALSVPRPRADLDAGGESAVERSLHVLLMDRFMLEPGVFVLERIHGGLARFEKDLAGDPSDLWTGNAVVETSLEADANRKGPIRVRVRVLRPGEQPAEETVSGPRDDLPKVAESVVTAVLKALSVKPSAGQWDVRGEAAYHRERAAWCMKAGEFGDAVVAADAALALQGPSEELAAMRLAAGCGHLRTYVWPKSYGQIGADLAKRQKAEGRAVDYYSRTPEDKRRFDEELRQILQEMSDLAVDNLIVLTGLERMPARSIRTDERQRSIRANETFREAGTLVLYLQSVAGDLGGLDASLKEVRTTARECVGAVLAGVGRTSRGPGVHRDLAYFPQIVAEDAAGMLEFERELEAGLPPGDEVGLAYLRGKFISAQAVADLSKGVDARAREEVRKRYLQARDTAERYMLGVYLGQIPGGSAELVQIRETAYEDLWELRGLAPGRTEALMSYVGMLHSLERGPAGQTDSDEEKARRADARYAYNLRYMLHLLDVAEKPDDAVDRELWVDPRTAADAKALYVPVVAAIRRHGDSGYADTAVRRVAEIEAAFPGVARDAEGEEGQDREEALIVRQLWHPYRDDAVPFCDDINFRALTEAASYVAGSVLWNFVDASNATEGMKRRIVRIDTATMASEMIPLPESIRYPGAYGVEVGGIEFTADSVALYYSLDGRVGRAVWDGARRAWDLPRGGPRLGESVLGNGVTVGRKRVTCRMVSDRPPVGTLVVTDLDSGEETLIASGQRNPPQSPLDVPGCFMAVMEGPVPGTVRVETYGNRGGGSAVLRDYEIESGTWKELTAADAELHRTRQQGRAASPDLIPAMSPRRHFVLEPRERIVFSGVWDGTVPHLTVQTATFPEAVRVPLSFRLSEDDMVALLDRLYEGDVTPASVGEARMEYENASVCRTVTTAAGLCIFPGPAAHTYQTFFWFIPKQELTEAVERFRENPVSVARKVARTTPVQGGMPRQAMAVSSGPISSEPGAQQGKRRSGMGMAGFAIRGAAALVLIVLLVAVKKSGKRRKAGSDTTVGLWIAALPAAGLAVLTGATPDAAAGPLLVAQAPAAEEVPANEMANRMVKAIEAGDTAAVRRMLDAGADPNGFTDKGYFPLRTAAFDDNVAITEMLLKAGADPNLKAPPEDKGRTALVAAAYGNPGVLKMLLAAKADPNLPTETDGLTPIMSAVAIALKEGDDTCVRILMAAGADPYACRKTYGGDGVFHWLSLTPKPELIRIVLQTPERDVSALSEEELMAELDRALREAVRRRREKVRAALRALNTED